MREYKFEIMNNNEFVEKCVIETEVNLTPYIKEYRNKYVGQGKGFNNLDGMKDEVAGREYNDNQAIFFVKSSDGEVVLPSGRWNAGNEYFKGDYRRALADIFYMIYMEKDVKEEIKQISFGKKKYVNIENVVFINDKEKKVMFDADEVSNEKSIKVTLCFPIEINGYSSILSSKSTETIYTLYNEKEGINLKWYGYEDIHHRKDGEYKIFKIDLFYGKHNGYKGIFYYFENTIHPKYGVKEIENECEIEATNVRLTFFAGEIMKLEEIKVNDKFKNFYNEPFFEKENYEKFEEEIKQYIINNCILTNEVPSYYIESSGDIKGKKEDNGNYIFDVSDEKDGLKFSYSVKPDEISLINSDFYYCFIELGTIIIEQDMEKVKIDIDIEYAGWVISFEEKGKTVFKVRYSELNKLEKKINFPQLPKGFYEYKFNRDCYTIKKMKEYFSKQKNEYNSFFKAITKLKDDEKKYLANNSISVTSNETQKIARDLFPAPNIINDNVVNQVYEALAIYKMNNVMPNFVIMGGPGTGKSTLVNSLAKCFGYNEKKVLHKSTSDLKGAYVGHTSIRMFDLLVNAAQNKQIVFIDEAYNLQEDQFGKEALEMMLPLLTGDRDDIESPLKQVDGKPNHYNFKDNNNNMPPIWLAGYEHDMRKMLSKNPGLYRRMVKISLSTPSVEGLYQNLLNKAERKNTKIRETLELCDVEIKNYIGWATSKEYVGYFGNYAGVDEFFRTCDVRLQDPEDGETKMSDDQKRVCINQIIDEKKSEIRKQYKAIMTETEKAKFVIQSDVETVLDDVKGNKKTVHKLDEIVTMLLNQRNYAQKGINIPKGALLVGPPGTGKTMLARAVAGEIQKRYKEAENKEIRIAFISTIATELDTPKKIESLFNDASEYDVSIVFIDEIDAIGKERDLPGAVPTLLIQLMKEMDGFEERKNIFVMAATNAPEVLDPALKRPGRFDRNIEVTYPDKEGRKDILKSYLKKLELFKGKKGEIESMANMLAEKTIQYVPAELKNLVNEAAILYEDSEEQAKENKKPVNHREKLTDNDSDIEKFEVDICEVLERIKVGELNVEKKEDKFQCSKNEGCSAVAIHEVGHALVSILIGLKPFEKITIIARGDALGYVSPSTRNTLRTKRDFLNQIRICLGGRVAEEMFYGDNISIGAAQDIQEATRYAENMITLFGMSDTIGPMAVKISNKNYLGKTENYTCSDSFRYEIDDAIRKLIAEQMSITRNMLEGEKENIQSLAEFIFKEETATGEEFYNVYKEKLNQVFMDRY